MTALLEMPHQEELTEVKWDFNAILQEIKGDAVKLSEAIRAGAKLTRPNKSSWFGEKPEGVISACALGAACYSVGGEKALSIQDFDDAAQYFPEIHARIRVDAQLVPEMAVIAAACGLPGDEEFINQERTLGSLIVALNDMAFTRRERIADIVEALGY
jgi:hypothetical protein